MSNNSMDKLNAISYSNLERLVQDYKIFIDTCSLIGIGDGREDKFIDKIIPLLKKYNRKIIVPFVVVKEIEKIIAKPKRVGLDKLALKAYNRLCKLQSQNCLLICGEEADVFADHVFQHVIAKFRITHKIILITEDKNLVSFFDNLNKDKSVHANEVLCLGINQYGFLSLKTGGVGASSAVKSVSKSVSKTQCVNNSKKPVFVSKLTTIKDDVIPVNYVPGEGDTVLTGSGKTIRIGSRISSGGEGVVYSIDKNNVAKIYNKDKITKRRFEKIKVMLAKGLNYPGICFPSEMILNSNKQFVGYIMPKAKGEVLLNCVFGKPKLMRYFPKWKKRDTVELALTILDKIKYLHNNGVIIGDINPRNIMVSSTKDVYFVDTDSYQIEGLPCPVFTPDFVAPEIQNKRFSEFLRTIGNENYAIATLLFEIMLPGKHPYAHQGGEDVVANIMKGEFSYPLGEEYNKKAPAGAWRFIWSHLTYKAKEAFHETFSRKGIYFAEDDRLSVKQWITIFREYLMLLDSGKFSDRDPMSAELFPTRFKIVDKTGKGSGSTSKSKASNTKTKSSANNSIYASSNKSSFLSGLVSFFENNF